MVASSLESAKDLIKECTYGRDITRANNGILIGSGKIEHLQRDEGRAIHAYNNEIQTPEVAHLFRSAYLPLHNEGARGTLYRTGDDIHTCNSLAGAPRDMPQNHKILPSGA